MIGYPVTLTALRKDIETHKKGWLARAEELTTIARNQGNFAGIQSIWSEVKPVFMRLQGGSKCAYCERKLESEDFGAIEQDVEHFRPKNRVSAWKPSKALIDAGVKLAATPGKDDGGYYLLAHEFLNYAAGCKPCNSTLKADRFPVAKAHVLDGEDPRKLKAKEKPYLLFPIGTWGDAPEKWLAFYGLSPYAVSKTGFNRLRALVTIEFFALGDVAKRKNLFLERARNIMAMFPQLEVLADPAYSVARKLRAKNVVDAATSSLAPHANCARSFKKLFERSPDDALAMFNAAVDYVRSNS